MPGVRVPIIGDAISVLKAFEQTKLGAKSVGTTVAQVNAEVAKSAQLQGAAGLKNVDRLRQQVAEYGRLSAAAKANSDEQAVYAAKQARAQAQLNTALGVSNRATAEAAATTGLFSRETRGAENDLNKLVRGGVAGTGVFSGMGRSLAFASTAFIGFSLGGEAISSAIKDAEQLDASVRSVDVTVRKMHGSVTAFNPELAKWASQEQKLGVSVIEATQGMARELAFTHDTTKARQAYNAALEISRVTGRNLSQVEIASAKAATGQTTALARYVGTIKSGTTWQQEYLLLQAKFGGQALANTTASERFRASLTNTETELGTALLPTFDKYISSLGDWLGKSENQKEIVDDVIGAVRLMTGVFKTAVTVIRGIDKVTGGLLHTLELLAAVKFASYIGGLDLLASKWNLVEGAATRAGAAESTALGANAAAGAGGGGAGAGLLGGAALGSQLRGPSVVNRVGQYTAAGGTAGGAAAAAKFGLGTAILAGGLAISDQKLPAATTRVVTKPDGSLSTQYIYNGKVFFETPKTAVFDGIITKALRQGASIAPPFLQGIRGFPGGPTSTGAGPFGSAQPQTQYFKSFSLSYSEQLAAAQAQLTQGTADDARQAKEEVARVKRLIDEGRLHGQALIDAINVESQALGTIWSAEQAAQQQRVDNLQKEKDQLDQRLSLLKQQDAKLSQRIQAIQAQYKAKVQSITQGIGALFQGPVLAPTDAQRQTALGLPGPTAKSETQDLRAQVAQYRRFNRDLSKLRKQGASKPLITELRGQGVSAIPEIEALTGGSKSQRDSFFKAYAARERLAQTTAKEMLGAQLHTLAAAQAQLKVTRAQERQVTAGDRLIANEIAGLRKDLKRTGVRTTASGQTSGRNPGR